MSSSPRWWRRHPVTFFILGMLISVALAVAGSVMITAADNHVPPTQPLDGFGGVMFGIGFVVTPVWLLWGLAYLGRYLFVSARGRAREKRADPSAGSLGANPAGRSGQDQADPAGIDQADPASEQNGQGSDSPPRRRFSFIIARGWRRRRAAEETGTPPGGEQQNGPAPAPETRTPPAGPGGAGPGVAGPARRWLYADKPVEPAEPDALSFGAYADALALLMDTEDTNTPLTIAINGPWGSGKTSLAKMTEGRLAIGSDWDAPHVVCWFDAWANDDAPHLGAAFAAAVAKAVNEQRYWWVRLAMPLPSVMLSPEQRWVRRLWYGGLALVLAAMAVFWPTGNSLLAPFAHPATAVSDLGHGSAATRLAWPALAVVVILLAQRLAPSIQGVARWIGAPGSEAARGSMADASGQLGHLIKQALRGRRRLIIFVDNLERCRPPRAVEVCEVVSQLIGHPDVVTVLIGDMDTIALSAEIKYAALETVSAKTGETGAYGRAYLEKLIQIQLRLPPPLPQSLHKMLVPADDEPREPSRSDPGLLATTADTVPPSRRGVSLAILSAILTVIVTIATVGADIPTFLLGLAAVVFSALTERTIESLRERQKKQDRTVIDAAVSEVLTKADTCLNWEKEKEVIQALRKLVESNEDGEISGTLQQYIESDVPDLSGPPDAPSVPDERMRTRWFIRRRMRQYLVSTSELRTALDNAVLQYLPLSPRGAKRMFNHAHLLLDIGIGRDIFGKQPPLHADQLAAWVALTERWPSVAAAIADDPALMEKLEEEARGTAPSFKHKRVGPAAGESGTGLDPALADLLTRGASLVPVVRLLVNFSPDPS
jgi:hypothetical protein